MDLLPVRISSQAFRERACTIFGINPVKESVFDSESEAIWVHRSCPPAYTHSVASDGNCLFRALSFYLTGGSERSHAILRSKVAGFLMRHSNKFRLLYGMSVSEWERYVKDISLDGVWGSDKELHAVATMLDADIWTFYQGRWLVYRPRFAFSEENAVADKLVNNNDKIERDAIYLLNDNEHYDAVIDIVSNRSVSYRLVSVVSRRFDASVGVGHYVCDAWNQRNNVWFHCDDQKVDEVSEDSVLKDCSLPNQFFVFEKYDGCEKPY